MQHLKKSNATPAVDAISSLPNVILSSILSLLPIKEAVATSILSKRWIHIWHLVDSINFPDIITVNSIQSAQIINEIMDSILVSRDATGFHLTKSFRLKIEYSDSYLACNVGISNVTKWVDHVVQHGLEYLCLRILVYYDDDDSDSDDLGDVIGQKPTLPISIFSCKTLVSLDLAQFRVKGFTFSSIGFGFPSLKILHLDYIVFQTVGDFMLLLVGCPNLEYLRAERIYLNYEDSSKIDFCCPGESLTIQVLESLSLPKLISAVVTQCWFSCFPVKVLSNSEYLCVETCMFCTKDDNMHEINPPQCPCYDNPIFHNLIHLELHDRLELVLEKLKYCPKLQKLELHQASFEIRPKQDVMQICWMEPKVVPQCVSSHLRTCIVHNFLGLQSELMMIKYILKNARNLQIMKIHYVMDHPEMELELSTCPLASATCQLYFIDHIKLSTCPKASATCQLFIDNLLSV